MRYLRAEWNYEVVMPTELELVDEPDMFSISKPSSKTPCVGTQILSMMAASDRMRRSLTPKQFATLVDLTAVTEKSLSEMGKEQRKMPMKIKNVYYPY